MQFKTTHWALLIIGTTLLAVILLWHDEASRHARVGETSHGPVLRVGYAIEAPYAELDDGGRVTGESPETLRALLRLAGRGEPQWVHVPFGDLIHELEMGRIDIAAAGVFITPERARRVDFTRPTVSARMGLLVRHGNPLDLHALEDVRRHPQARLAVLAGSVEETVARALGLSGPQLLSTPDALTAVAAVRDGQAAGLALSAPSLRLMAGQPGLAMAEPFRDTTPPGLSNIGYPAFALRHGDAMRAKLDEALARFQGSPEHLALIARHGFTAAEVDAARRFTP